LNGKGSTPFFTEHPTKTLDEEEVVWLHSKTTIQRFRMVEALNRLGRRMIAEQTRRQSPEWSEEQVNRKVARMFGCDENASELYATDVRHTGIFDDL
jgi:hypothetical protein